MERRLFLGAGLLVLSGCGGSNGSKETDKQAAPSRAPIPPDPGEVQYADIVFDGVSFTDRNGSALSEDQFQNTTKAHVNRKYWYVWDRKWGWHWVYMAYDTGHRYNPAEFANKPHLNFAVYYRYSDMQADINNRENKRTEYDGHFFIFRRAGSIICFRYDVSIDKKAPSNRGTKYDTCYSMPNATALAVAGVVVIVVGLTIEFAPLIVPALVLLPIGL